MGFLANKRILITGMISTRSIAYGIAQSMYREGAELAFTYQGERVRDRVEEMAKKFGSELIYQCDVAAMGWPRPALKPASVIWRCISAARGYA